MTRITQISIDDRVSGASGVWYLAARLCLAAVFLHSGVAKLLFWAFDEPGLLRLQTRENSS
jgi:uncharacterized membrane protein YphA (DoxX/SURF4 family)